MSERTYLWVTVTLAVVAVAFGYMLLRSNSVKRSTVVCPTVVCPTVVCPTSETSETECPTNGDPEHTEAAFTLTMGDEHVASWMPVENGFTKRGNSSFKHRSGFLVQLGGYFDIANGQKAHLREYTAAVKIFEVGGDTQTLSPDEFDWINVVAGPSSPPPISRAQASLLFPDSAIETKCDFYDNCAETLQPNKENRKCFCGPDCVESPQLRNIRSSCVRQRTIHAHFDADAVITFWEGASGYTVAARPTNYNDHNSFTFTSEDEVTVEIYRGNQKEEVGKVSKIRIVGHHDDSKSQHGEVHEPPLGGTIGTGP